VQDNSGSVIKAQVLLEAIQRVDKELSRREEIETGKPSPAEFARRADPGRSGSNDMRPKKRQEEFEVGTTRREIGRVSQADKVAQARKDSDRT
jgi:hypothetical protein